MGEKAFEQCAGFLRISGGDNPLDNSAVHPESYPIVERMARDLGCGIPDLIRDKSLREKIDPTRYVTATVGLPTLTDILAELDKPGRDPRQGIQVIKENGLVHVSEMADRFISDPTQVVSIHQHVKVKVLSVDLQRKRVQLTMKGI